MKEELKVFIRYFLTLFLVLIGAKLFTFIFTTLTIISVFKILSLFYSTILRDTTISINNFNLVFIEACIAPSAYILITILNLSVPWKSTKKLMISLLLGYVLFLTINIARIILLANLFIHNSVYFDEIHKFLWYSVSTFVVIFIWFFQVYAFKIKSTPFITDINNFYLKTKP